MKKVIPEEIENIAKEIGLKVCYHMAKYVVCKDFEKGDSFSAVDSPFFYAKTLKELKQGLLIMKELDSCKTKD